MKDLFVKKEEFRWSFLKKGKNVLNVCTKMLLLFGFAFSMTASTEAHANPEGGVVVGGAATITNTPAELQIHQSSQNAIINWNSFNIGAGETTRFYQPNSSSTALNRVFNSTQLSTISGNLVANGRVVIINPNGVLIGKGAHVDTAGFVATSADIANSAFMNGTGPLNFNVAGKANASVVNEGTITVADTGLVALVAPNVRNDGVIQGNLSKIQLGAADTFGVDFYGDGLINLAVGSSTEARTLKAENNGSITAAGGKVLMTAAAASDVVASVINNTGVVEANALQNVNGQIILLAEGATTNVSGKLTAEGGFIETSGTQVNIADSAVITASDWLIDPLSIKIFNFILNPGEFDLAYSNVSAGVVNLSLSTGTNVTITTSGFAFPGQNNHGDIIVANDLAKLGGGNATLTLNATRNIEFKNSADIYSVANKLNVNLNAGGSITNNANNTVITNGGNYFANAGTSVNLAGDVTTGAGNLTVLGSSGSSAGNVATAGLNSTSGTINVSTNQGTVTLNNGATSTSGNIVVSGSGAVAANNTVQTGGAGTVTLTSTGSSVNAAAITAAGGNIAVNAATNATLTGTATNTGAGAITVTGSTGGSAGNVSVAGLNTASGAINVSTDQGTVTLNNGATSTSGNVTVSGSGAVLSSANISTGGAGTVTLTSTGDNVTAQSIAAANGKVTVKANKAVSLQNVSTTNGGIKISNGGNFDITTGNLSIISANGALGLLDVDSNNNLTTGDVTVADNSTTTDASEVAFLTSGSGGGASSLTTGNISVTSTSGNTTRLVVNSKQGALTVNGDVTVTNVDSADPAYTSTAKAELTAKGNVSVNGAGGITVSATDLNQPNLGAESSLAVKSTQGGVNIAGAVTTSATQHKTTPLADGGYQTAKTALTIDAKNDIVVGGTISGTATSTNTVGLQENTNALVSVVSTDGDLWLGNEVVTATASDAVEQHTYDGAAYNNTTTTDAAANSATVILSGAKKLKNLTITADDASKTYGDTKTFAGTEFTNSAMGPYGTVTGVTLTSTGAPATADVGAYAINASNATGTYLYNYNIAYVDGTLTVGKKSLTVSADAKTKTYGTNDPTLTYTQSGLVNGDTLTLTRDQFGTLAGEQVGSYGITIGTFAKSGNYDVTYTANNLTITKANLKVTADNKSKTYGTNDPTLTYSQTGLVNVTLDNGVVINDTITGNLSRTGYGTLAGEQANTFLNPHYNINQGTVAVSAPSNYNTTFTKGKLVINRANLLLATDNKTKVYGTNDPTLTYTANGLVTGVTLANGVTINDAVVGFMFRAGYGTVAGEQVGSYTIGGLGAPVNFWNYNTTYSLGKLTITPATLVITADDLSKTYGDNDPSLTYSQTGLVNHLVNGVMISDSISGSLTRDGAGTRPGQNVGDYNITQGTVAVSKPSNYIVNFVDGTLTIDKKTLTVSAVTDTKQYDGTVASFGVPVGFGLVNGTVDGVSISDTLTGTQVFASKDVLGPNGSTLLVTSYTINDTNGGDNYNVVAVDTALGTITAAPLTVTAGSFSKPFGTTLTFNGTEFTTSGTLYGSDAVTGVSLSSLGAPSSAPIGSYAVNASNATGTGVGNYDITYIAGNLNVRASNLGPAFQIDPLGRPIISVGDMVLNYYPSFEPRQTKTLNVDVSIRGGSNNGPTTTNQLANLQPAGGTTNPEDLANIQPAAGGNGNSGGSSAKGNFSCANDFLDGKDCTVQ